LRPQSSFSLLVIGVDRLYALFLRRICLLIRLMKKSGHHQACFVGCFAREFGLNHPLVLSSFLGLCRDLFATISCFALIMRIGFLTQISESGLKIIPQFARHFWLIATDFVSLNFE
jgi:hypothetical protein